MQNYFLIRNNKAYIRYEALFYFGLDMSLLDEKTLFNSEDTWVSFFMKSNNESIRYIEIETIPSNIKTQYKIPSIEEIRETIPSEQTDLDIIEEKKLSRLVLILENQYQSEMFKEDKKNQSSSHYLRYIEKGYKEVQAKILSRSFIMLSVCLNLKTHYTIEQIYKALRMIVGKEIDTNKYAFSFKIDSLRTFYNYLKDAHPEKIETIIEHGLFGKPSNRKAICKNTENLVVHLLQHFNQPSDETVKAYANTAIIALPNSFNNGKIISRQKVNQIKNGPRKNEINVAIHGNNWTRQYLIPDVHRVKTQYPLDCVEIDFTKIHVNVVDDDSKKTKLFICNIKDRCTKAILGYASGQSESFELFQIAYRRMLELTNGKHPIEIVYDNSTAFTSLEFNRIKSFLEGLSIKFTLTGNAQAKGGIESHFKTLLEAYLPMHIGTLGGNIATTKRHRPKHEILVILSKKEFMDNEVEWDKILREINQKYNCTTKKGKVESPIDEFRNLEKPHAIQLDEQYLAFISWHRTNRKFLQSEFMVEFDKKVYHFGWKPSEIMDSQEKYKFLMERTGDVFDIYMHPTKGTIKPLYVFEKDSLKFLYSMDNTQMYYGNNIDHRIDPKRKKELSKLLSDRKNLGKRINQEVRTLNKTLKDTTGVDLNTFFNEVNKNGEMTKVKKDFSEDALEILNNKEAIKIDPFTSDVSSLTKKKIKNTVLHKPLKVKFKSNGKGI
ncbi:MAG: transposase family protein [Cytophagales bacterium]|nr:transposase family protein [Cytophagales bacterium]